MLRIADTGGFFQDIREQLLGQGEQILGRKVREEQNVLREPHHEFVEQVYFTYKEQGVLNEASVFSKTHYSWPPPSSSKSRNE
jgi:hypothetical protein